MAYWRYCSVLALCVWLAACGEIRVCRNCSDHNPDSPFSGDATSLEIIGVDNPLPFEATNLNYDEMCGMGLSGSLCF